MLVLIRNIMIGKQTLMFTLIISVLAVGGIWLLAYSTPFGLGLNDDSIAYIAGARSIMEGNGYRAAWLASNGPVIHFPPGYPAVLAFIGLITNLDPIRGARALNGVLFGLNIAVAGWLGWQMTKSRLAGIFVASLTLLSSSILFIHTRAMSEPLYILLMLLSFLLIDLYFKRSQNHLLVVLGFMLGWAYLARYAAISLLATVLAALLVLHSSWRQRFKSILILFLSAFPWILAWSIRNRVVGGSFTNRVLSWHPITIKNWRKAKGTFSDFLVPVDEWQKSLDIIPNFFTFLLIAIGLALLIWVLIKGIPRLLKPKINPRPGVLSFVNGLYVIAYLLTLVATMTLFDPATKFQVRILSPTYISLLLLLMVLGLWLWKKKSIFINSILMFSSIGLLGMFAYGQIISVQDLRKSGAVFTSAKWSKSAAIAAINEFPKDVLILSNEPGVVYLYTGRPSGVLPKKEPGISNIKQPVLDGDIAIVLIKVNRANSDTLRYYYDLGRGLYHTDLSNTWLFTAFPD
ncbi:MAG: hypothetical protein QGM50_00865 [Anaerolineae bacterium]|nr:hypothetical protein [Anaerolineae bacterium]